MRNGKEWIGLEIGPDFLSNYITYGLAYAPEYKKSKNHATLNQVFLLASHPIAYLLSPFSRENMENGHLLRMLHHYMHQLVSKIKGLSNDSLPFSSQGHLQVSVVCFEPVDHRNCENL